MLARIPVVEFGVADLDRQLAAPLHGVTAVDRQVEDSVLDLGRIGERVPEAAGHDELNFDRLADRSPQQVFHARR